MTVSFWRQGRSIACKTVALLLLPLLGECNMSTINRSTAQPFLEALQRIADAYHPAKGEVSAPEQLAAAVTTLKKSSTRVDPECVAVLQYHEARILAIAGSVDEARKLLPAPQAGKFPLPEALWLTIQLSAAGTDEASNRRRWDLEDQLGNLLPLSSWGRLRDMRLEEREAERAGQPQVDAPRLVIPLLDRGKLLEIATAFRDMKMYEEAANSYREALYGGFAPPPFPQFGEESWVSSDTADIWTELARLEASLGRTGRFVQALFMAVSASRKQEATARSLLSETFERRPTPPQTQPDAEKLRRIATLYRDCHLHPRGLLALRVAAKIPGVNLIQLENQLSGEWQQLVATYAKGHESTSFLFGYKLADQPTKDLSPHPVP